MIGDSQKEKLLSDYIVVSRDLERLEDISVSLIEELLEANELDILRIQCRVKSDDSFIAKCDRKTYDDPLTEITDLLGIRIIVYTEREIRAVEAILKGAFEIDFENSVDNTKSSDPRTFGYRSLHIVCSLGSNRQGLPEYRGITDYRFEVQIRTALQHAWAEIEHKQNYKSEKALPLNLQRRLFTAAACLEMLDREFEKIIDEAEEYSKEIVEKRPEFEIENINQISIRVVFDEFLKDIGLSHISTAKTAPQTTLIAVDELAFIGVGTVQELRHLIDRIDKSAMKNAIAENNSGNILGIARLMMFADDFRKYKRDANRASFSLSEHAKKLIRATNDIDDPEHLANKLFFPVDSNISEP